MAFNIVRVSTLPQTLVANTMYLVKEEDDLRVVVAGNTGEVAAETVTGADVDGAVLAAIQGLNLDNNAHLAADIDARDALTLTKSGFVLVVDATDDSTVETGSALYFYDLTSETFTKVSEYESMDWANSTVLGKLAEDNGQLTYDGVPVGTVQQGEHQW